jgi:AraC-like DNA-binding protein
MNLKTTKLSKFDSLELKEATFQNLSFPSHFHDTYSIGFIKEGVERVTINNQTLLATANSIVIINPFEVHSNSFYNNDKLTYQSMYLNKDILKFFASKLNLESKDEFHFKNLLFDSHILNELKCLHTNPDLNTQNKLSSIIYNLILKHQNLLKHKINSYVKDATIIEELIAKFNNNFMDKVDIQKISKTYQLSSSQLIRAFKAHTGLTPISYITLLRLNHSKKLILNNQSMVQVALECGFYDQSHFTHSFSKFFGISPLKYRKNCFYV